jgi:hypothetical protein
MPNYITNSNSAACRYALRRHLPPLRSVFGGDAAVLDGAAGRFEEVAAAHAAAAA